MSRPQAEYRDRNERMTARDLRNVAVSMIDHAEHAYIQWTGSCHISAVRNYQEQYNWVNSPDPGRPDYERMTFIQACAIVSLDPDTVRAEFSQIIDRGRWVKRSRDGLRL